jgi:hypothetical protein
MFGALAEFERSLVRNPRVAEQHTIRLLRVAARSRDRFAKSASATDWRTRGRRRLCMISGAAGWVPAGSMTMAASSSQAPT